LPRLLGKPDAIFFYRFYLKAGWTILFHQKIKR
jgi:hypothetical protein